MNSTPYINVKNINAKKQHREFLEVEAMKLYNLPNANPEKTKVLTDMIMSDILRISAEIIDLENGNFTTFEIEFEKYTNMAADYTRNIAKLRAETDHDVRCEMILRHNRWAKFKKWLKEVK